ncbi:MAG: hypothetical protein IJN42_05645, partial [Clostridia bacterium]|nr:hypothetical protein [Clostridia bacterium]
LFEHFKTVEAMKRANFGELCALPGLTKNAATAVYHYFHGEEQS